MVLVQISTQLSTMNARIESGCAAPNLQNEGAR